MFTYIVLYFVLFVRGTNAMDKTQVVTFVVCLFCFISKLNKICLFFHFIFYFLFVVSVTYYHYLFIFVLSYVNVWIIRFIKL